MRVDPPRFDPHPAAEQGAPVGVRGARILAIAMIAVLALGLGAGVAALAGARGRDRLAGAGTLRALLDGRLAGAVNGVMAHDLPGDGLWRALGGVWRWVLFRSGGPQVSPGCGNWLFLTEELRPWADGDAALQSRAEAAGRVAAALAARHVGLLVALVPDKARVEQASLCGVRVSAQSQARYGRFLAALRAQGVQVADLWAADRRAGNLPGLYYRTDTHWSQRGAALAADAVAASVATGVPAGTPTIIPTGTPAGGGAFTTRAGPVAERAGDLLRLMSLDHVPNLLRPHPDREAPEHTVAEAAAGAGLLDDGAAPSVVLLGTSFSLNGNFAGRLEQALGREVAQFATEGGGFDGAAARFFAGPFWRDTPPRLVVWEMPERVADQPPGAAELDFWQGRSGGSIAGPR